MNKVQMLKEAILEFYQIEKNMWSGGNLHLILDDGNYDNESIRFCYNLAKEKNDFFGKRLAYELLCCTEEERKQILDLEQYGHENIDGQYD